MNGEDIHVFSETLQNKSAETITKHAKLWGEKQGAVRAEGSRGAK